MNYILFDPPETWENLLPLTFTRPVCEIRTGILTTREKWEKFLQSKASILTRSYLQTKFSLHIEDDNMLINGSVLPDDSLLNEIGNLPAGTSLYAGDTLVAIRLDRAEAAAFDMGKYQHGDRVTLSITPIVIAHPWDIFTLNGQALEADFQLLTKNRVSAEPSNTNIVLNPENVFIESDARIEGAILNAGTGPIYIGEHAEIMEGSAVRGPFAMGEYSTLKMGAKIYGPTTIGPFSSAGGEIKNSVIQGYSNKTHEGFLGNSVLGEWCNIGADSNNSNLKNNYAEVKLWNYREEKFVSTGLQFCGLIMGDHSKCGINTMFNTGTVVGVYANIYGAGFPPNFVPSFSWGGPAAFTTYQIDKAFEVAAEVMKRRDRPFDQMEKDILTAVFEMTEKYRS
ncbi:MAG: glucose-1-phosphate thymidylyltransferase [Bacteroides sp. SM1_62]|nr:MAG: glucose-1-phosphate thymidylyltransferase [Bacteroides sp. SM1_62]